MSKPKTDKELNEALVKAEIEIRIQTAILIKAQARKENAEAARIEAGLFSKAGNK